MLSYWSIQAFGTDAHGILGFVDQVSIVGDIQALRNNRMSQSLSLREVPHVSANEG